MPESGDNPTRGTPTDAPTTPAARVVTRPARAGYNPGDTVAGRYRIVATLGRGGMGEVFRADDLTLGVPVAVKFLPDSYASDPVWLDRFKAEVRVARRVSHPNVCRVFDIAEADGRHFLTMEFIDGEDLSSLLRRIGRLPEDKALQVAHQICRAVAAAHEQGVIHRDLKPGNIMIDGRGNARIADFGIAGLAEDLRGRTRDVSGTPAYMAPEQLAGGEVGPRSDIYALGLVLYELFTGKAAFTADTMAELLDQRRSSFVTPPTEHIRGLDPAVERVILRCLEPDPLQRPQSAIAVAAGLPGGDPLAAAMAAGETPSPEMVALAGNVGGLRTPNALLALAACLVLAIGAVLFSERVAVHRLVPLDEPPAALVSKARAHARSLGVVDRPESEAWGFTYDEQLLARLKSHPDAGQVRARLAAGQPAAIMFWYRRSPRVLTPQVWWQRGITATSPPLAGPGEVYVVTDSLGRLLRFDRIPPTAGFGDADPAATPDWPAAIRAAGLDPGAFTPTPPGFIGPGGADARVAWTGRSSIDPALEYRVEAASLQGVPVGFRAIPPWRLPTATPVDESGAAPVISEVTDLLVLVAIISSVFLAVRHLRLRQGDLAGAMRLSLIITLCEWLAMVLPVNDLTEFFKSGPIGRPVARAIWTGVLCLLLYLAIEPLVRRQWPQVLISWARLLGGRIKDPLVGRDALLGILAGACMAFLMASGSVIDAELSGRGQLTMPALAMLGGFRFVLSGTVGAIAAAGAVSMLLLLLMVGVRMLTGRLALVYGVLTAVTFMVGFAGRMDSVPGIAAGAACSVLLTIMLIRVGLLAYALAFFSGTLIINAPMSASLAHWTGEPTAVVCLAMGAIAVAGFLTSTAPYRPRAANAARATIFGG